jgi:NADPH:quinone reductase-like Zn-dependent oxidoreductase
VGPWDVLVREGRSGLALTLPVTLGADLSGVVVEVGDDVEDLAPGDAIFGVTNDRFVGAYAEFALADASPLARKPVGLGSSFSLLMVQEVLPPAERATSLS